MTRARALCLLLSLCCLGAGRQDAQAQRPGRTVLRGAATLGVLGVFKLAKNRRDKRQARRGKETPRTPEGTKDVTTQAKKHRGKALAQLKRRSRGGNRPHRLASLDPNTVEGLKQVEPGHNLTGGFQEHYAQAYDAYREGGGPLALPEEVTLDFVALTVDGLFSGAYPGYMRGTRRGLRDLGIDTRRAETNSSRSAQHNKQVLARQISAFAARGQKVLLFSQSKGAFDVAEFVRQNPELRRHLVGVIAIQGPQYGNPHVKNWEKKTAKRLRLETVEDFEPRGEDHDLANPYPAAEVPTLSVATRSEKGPQRVPKSETSDGVVPTSSQYIGGTYGAFLDEVNHVQSVYKLPGNGGVDQRAFAQAAVRTLLGARRGNGPADARQEP